jgi:hypothetical protein
MPVFPVLSPDLARGSALPSWASRLVVKTDGHFGVINNLSPGRGPVPRADVFDGR